MNQNEINSQNNINNMQKNTLTSINPIKIDDTSLSSISETVVNQNTNLSSNKPPKNNKVSTFLLILLFIFLFAFIMGMPYISDFIDNLKADTGLSEIEQEAKKEEERQEQENNKNNQQTNNTLKLRELICSLNDTSNSNYQLLTTQKFNYNNKNQIINSSIISEYNFASIDSTYQILKDKCSNDSLKYLDREGYIFSCSYNDTSVKIGNTFELETFKTIIDSDTNIEANATYKQDINTIKNNLISQGYTCE